MSSANNYTINWDNSNFQYTDGSSGYTIQSNSTGTNPVRIHNDSWTPQRAGTNGCNESLIHSNAEKAVFHTVKGAGRFADEGLFMPAARMAAYAGRSFLRTEDINYDQDRSKEYLQEFINEIKPSNHGAIGPAIDRAFHKIKIGNHKGGARIAVSIGDRWVDGFDGTSLENDSKHSERE